MNLLGLIHLLESMDEMKRNKEDVTNVMRNVCEHHISFFSVENLDKRNKNEVLVQWHGSYRLHLREMKIVFSLPQCGHFSQPWKNWRMVNTIFNFLTKTLDWLTQEHDDYGSWHRHNDAYETIHRCVYRNQDRLCTDDESRAVPLTRMIMSLFEGSNHRFNVEL